MTVIHIIAGIDYFGGAEQMVFKLSNKCKEHNIKPIVVSITNYGNDNEFFFNLNIEHYFLDSWGFKDFGKAMKQIKEIIKKNDDVVIHSHMFHAGILASFYTLFYKKVPIVFTMHTNKVRVFYRRVLLFLTKPFRKFDIIFSHNSNKWYLKNNAIIANGIDFSRFKIGKKRVYEPKSQFKFLFIGRITEPKNPLFMVDLVKKLKQHNYNFKITSQ